MNKKESKYVKTAQKMGDALLSILKEKEFEFITVKDICKEANVNRSTFYLHYENTADLLDELISKANDDFNEAFSSIEKKNPLSSSKGELMFIKDEYLIPYLTFVKEHKKVYQAAMSNASLFGVNKMKSAVYENFVEKIFIKYGIEDKYKDYYFAYFVSGIQAIVLRWVAEGCGLEIEEVVDLIKAIVKKDEKPIHERKTS